MKLPEDLTHLFGNYDISTLDLENHAPLIIKTVLARGRWEQVLGLFKYFGYKKVQEVFRDDYYGLRSLPEPTLRLWELYFIDEPIPREEITKNRWRCRRLANRSTEANAIFKASTPAKPL
ncbi:DUF6922 domain-containing protein [Moorella sp. Hama-1]|uniref:DUF6922 domain-containing protein n=1 Tax=Moorella sp. Hama-1 TaxID=2138101 RepID=UPI00352BA5CD